MSKETKQEVIERLEKQVLMLQDQNSSLVTGKASFRAKLSDEKAKSVEKGKKERFLTLINVVKNEIETAKNIIFELNQEVVRLSFDGNIPPRDISCITSEEEQRGNIKTLKDLLISIYSSEIDRNEDYGVGQKNGLSSFYG